MIREYSVSGMTCAACSASVERVVRRVEGVDAATVNLATERLRVRSERPLDEEIMAAIAKAGFSATPAASHIEQSKLDSARHINELKAHRRKLIVALIFAIPLFYMAMAPMVGLPSLISPDADPKLYAGVQLLLLIPVIIAGRHFYVRGFGALFKLHPNMDSLIAIGTVASLCFSLFSFAAILNGQMHAVHGLYFESAGVIIALVLLGKYFEQKSKGRTTEAIEKLIALAPETAYVRERDGTVVETPVKELLTGDIIEVRPGSSIPVDGIIIEGSTTVDESMLTGESMPLDKTVSDTVTGGSLNGNGMIAIQATQVGEDTALAQMIKLVEEAQGNKAPVSRLADKISGVFVPVVGAIAAISAGIWLLMDKDLSFVLTVFVSALVIACPCALGLATPTAVMVGTGKAARLGILIKSGEALETACQIQTIVLDKTGTVTQGKPVVTDFEALEMDEDEFLALYAAGEKNSEHPLGAAIVDFAKQRNLEIPSAFEFTAIAGKGATAVVDGKKLIMGNASLMQENGIIVGDYAREFAQQGKTLMFMAINGILAGFAAVADIIKPNSREAVKRLSDMGIEVILATGDNKRTAAAIALQAGIQKFESEVLPQNKSEIIKKLQKGKEIVGMVGDGINDAIALTQADVGFAIGSGTDVAIASADVVLMRTDLNSVADAIELSRRTMRIIKQNLFWAFAYNIIGIPIAAGALYSLNGMLLNPMIAALAMSFSSVTVLANALRLKR